MSNIELRHLAERPEFRSDETGKKIIATGYAALFNVRSRDLGGFHEVIMPTAFKKTLKESNVRAYQDHNRALYLGSTGNGSVRLDTDDRGLHYEIDLPDTSVGRDAAVLIERGDMSGASFGFRAHAGSSKVKVEADGTLLRSLHDVGLHHIAPLTEDGAYTEATAELAFRSLALAHDLDPNAIDEARKAGNVAELFERSSETPSTTDIGTADTNRRPPTHRPKVRRYRRVE